MTYIKLAAGIIMGGAFGFGIYKVYGCSTGTCPLTANPWISPIYGAILGAVMVRL